MALLSLFMKENHTWLYSDLWRTIVNNCTRLFILSSLIYKCTKKSNIIIVNEHVQCILHLYSSRLSALNFTCRNSQISTYHTTSTLCSVGMTGRLREEGVWCWSGSELISHH